MKKFTNSFNDNGRAIVDTKARTAFYYSFSGHAHIIAQEPDRYRLATQREADHLEIFKDRNPYKHVFNLP